MLTLQLVIMFLFVNDSCHATCVMRDYLQLCTHLKYEQNYFLCSKEAEI